MWGKESPEVTEKGGEGPIGLILHSVGRDQTICMFWYQTEYTLHIYTVREKNLAVSYYFFSGFQGLAGKVSP
jgi:hypothetical protein